MQDLKQLLNESIVNWTYEKVNGEIRSARGTRAVLNNQLLRDLYRFTDDDMPKGVKPQNDNVVTYWDLDKNAWRSCKADAVIVINDVIPIEDVVNTINNA